MIVRVIALGKKVNRKNKENIRKESKQQTQTEAQENKKQKHELYTILVQKCSYV